MNKEQKNSLPLIHDRLSVPERRVFELIEKDQLLEAEKNKRKTDSSDSNENKVMVKATLPLVADFLGCDEKRVKELFELDMTITSKKSTKKTTKPKIAPLYDQKQA